MTSVRVKPLCEVLRKGFPSTIFSFEEKDQAEELINMSIPGTQGNYIFLDLHGVLDTCNSDQLTKLKSLNTTIIGVSFVGHTTGMRIFARNHIQNLLDNDIIQLGTLVFSRKYSKKVEGKRRRCLIDGSKYYIVNGIVQYIKEKSQISENLRFIFLDDNIDHVYAVREIPEVDSQLFEQSGNDLLTLLMNWVK